MGEGGIGKTRLAIVLAQAVKQQFADGVWFVSLVEIEADESDQQQLLYAIGNAVGYRFVGSSDAKSQLLAYLQARQCLLILDNFEHLVECADLVLDLLDAAHGLKILVTSRQRLNLGVEYVYRLTGLALPSADPLASEPVVDSAQSEGTTSESAALFIERANRMTTTLTLTTQTQQAIHEICALVNGLPLAIELAAGLVDRYTCAEISQLLRANYDILSSSARDLPSRQRNMKVVLDTSYSMLTPAEQRAFAFCSVFQGGFTNQTALAVTGTTPDILTELVNNSMIRRDGVGRLSMHELMAQYAAEQLRIRSGKITDDEESEQTLRDRHCAYFADFLNAHSYQLTYNQNADEEIAEELENIRAAWQWGLNRQRSDDLLRAQPALFTFIQQVGHMHEADTLLRYSLKRVQDWLDDADDEATQTAKSIDQELLIRLLTERAGVCIVLSHTDEADRLIAEVFQHLETFGALQNNLPLKAMHSVSIASWRWRWATTIVSKIVQLPCSILPVHMVWS